MKKIAIIRGSYMNKAEMCIYEPLNTDYKLMGYTNQLNYHDISKIKFPIKKLPNFKYFPDKVNKAFDILADKFFQKTMKSARYMPGLINEIKDKDIINVDFNYAYTLQAIAAKIKYGKKIVVRFSHNIPSLFMEMQSINGSNEKSPYSEVDLFFAISERAKETLLLEGVPESKIKIIPHGVDLNTFKPREKNRKLMQDLGINENDIIVLFVGSIEKIKGIQFLILAAHKILNDPDLKNLSIKFIFAGKGNKENEMKELVRKLNIQRSVIFASFITHDKIPYVYNLADVFVLPSIATDNCQEKFGIVLIESMASGVPVVSTYCGAIPEVIGSAGILVQPSDFIVLYDSIKKLILNDKLHKKVIEKGFDRVNNKFSHKNVSYKIKQIYDELLK